MRPAGGSALLDVEIKQKTFVTAAGERLEVLRDIGFVARPWRGGRVRRSVWLR